MARYPNLLCKWCREPFPNPRTRGQHPRTCPTNPECARQLTKHEKEHGVTCDRCTQPLQRTHPAIRFHPTCRDGCVVCGGKLKPGVLLPTGPRPRRLLPIYCSEVCQEAAWAQTALPICRKCKQPVALPRAPLPLRNPPSEHPLCTPVPAPPKPAKQKAKVTT